MWTIFKVIIEFVTILLVVYVLIFLAISHVGSSLPDQGSNLHPLPWQAKSQPLDHEGSPRYVIFISSPPSEWGNQDPER